MNVIKSALESMVWQFGHHGVKNGKPIIWTGGLSALEEAFEVLGWQDPHYLQEKGNTCEIKGCVEPITSQTTWDDLYLCLCREHHHDCCSGKPRPPVKKYALKREATRDPITRTLPC